MDTQIFNKIKKFTKDISLNIVSNLLIIGTTQLIINPFLAAKYGTENFGVMLSITGIATIISSVFGTALNNTRLINDAKYKKSNVRGDFNFLLIIGIISSLFLSIIVLSFFFTNIKFVEYFYIIIYILLCVLRSYIQVFYRLNLSFDRLIKESVAVIIGYLLGILFSEFFSHWIIVYLLGEMAGVIYLTITVKWFKEPLKKTIFWNSTFLSYSQLGFTNVIASSLTYMDRILIFPVLGSSSVSIYYIATVVGKMGSFIATPLSNMLLSYLANIESNKVSKYFKYIIVCSFLFGFGTYFLLLFVTPYVLDILYSDEMVRGALNIYKLTNIAITIQMVNTIIRPLIIKFCPAKWLILNQGAGLLVYLLSSLVLMDSFGLSGYCISAIITQVLLYGINVFILSKYLKIEK